jgi:hypothetical protein
VFRDILKAEHLENLEKGMYNYQKGSIYNDIFNECERLADYAINVSESLESVSAHLGQSKIKIPGKRVPGIQSLCGSESSTYLFSFGLDSGCTGADWAFGADVAEPPLPMVHLPVN